MKSSAVPSTTKGKPSSRGAKTTRAASGDDAPPPQNTTDTHRYVAGRQTDHLKNFPRKSFFFKIEGHMVKVKGHIIKVEGHVIKVT